MAYRLLPRISRLLALSRANTRTREDWETSGGAPIDPARSSRRLLNDMATHDAIWDDVDKLQEGTASAKTQRELSWAFANRHYLNRRYGQYYPFGK